jgi:hypothetical protein
MNSENKNRAEVGTLNPRDTREEEGAMEVTPYRDSPPPPSRPHQPSAPPSFRDLQGFVDELASESAVERSRQLAAAYDRACEALVGPNDEQEAEGRKFKKKSAWRKLGRHFHVSVEAPHPPHGRWERWPHDDVAHFVAHAEVVATAPWGQTMPGFGACSTRERRFYTGGPLCPLCGGSMWDNRDRQGGEDFACRNKRSCGGALNPGDWTEEDLGLVPNEGARAKAEHDCMATAQTRAINRAISELIAMGEVSWEEVEGREVEAQQRPNPGRNGKRQGRPQRGSTPREDRAGTPQLDWTVRVGRHKGTPYGELCRENPEAAWWLVRKADRVDQDVKDMLREYLDRLAQEGAQDGHAGGAQAEPEPDPLSDPLTHPIPGGKHKGKTWGQVLGEDLDYFRKLASHPWSEEHWPAGSELRAAVEVALAGDKVTPLAVLERWAKANGANRAWLQSYGELHPIMPADLFDWEPAHARRALAEARQHGWETMLARVERAMEGKAKKEPTEPQEGERTPDGDTNTQEGAGEPGGGADAPQEPNNGQEEILEAPPERLPAKIEKEVERALYLAARHHLPKLREWREAFEEASEAGRVSRVQDLVSDLKSQVFHHISRGRSPVAGGKAEAQEELGLGSES